jgi:hypothetical protein
MKTRTLLVLFVSIAVGALALSACASGEAAASLGDQTQARYGNGNGGFDSQGALEAGAQVPAQYTGRGGNSQGGNGRGGNTGGGQGRGGQGNGGPGVGGGAALTPLSEAEASALLRAIEEEYGAQALYESVLQEFGNVEPFNLIAASEAQHAAALVRQAEKYGLEVPEYTGPASAATFATLEEACQAGVAAEIADAALYDELSPAVAHTDILRVFENLKNASLNSHLPAFEDCQ